MLILMFSSGSSRKSAQTLEFDILSDIFAGMASACSIIEWYIHFVE
jgi:hypothetical protein